MEHCRQVRAQCCSGRRGEPPRNIRRGAKHLRRVVSVLWLICSSLYFSGLGHLGGCTQTASNETYNLVEDNTSTWGTVGAKMISGSPPRDSITTPPKTDIFAWHPPTCNQDAMNTCCGTRCLHRKACRHSTQRTGSFW